VKDEAAFVEAAQGSYEPVVGAVVRTEFLVSADEGREESSYYGYNAHTDVEQITSDTGHTRALSAWSDQ
jgi:hypothetical protein